MIMKLNPHLSMVPWHGARTPPLSSLPAAAPLILMRSGKNNLSSSMMSSPPISVTCRQKGFSASSIALVRKILPGLWRLHPHLQSYQLLPLLHLLLRAEEPCLAQLYPLVSVAHAGVLYQSTEHHEEANKEVDIYGLHVGYLGQSSIDRVDKSCHGEHGGHAKTHPGRSSSTVKPEGHPGHHHDQAGRDVHLETRTWKTMIS